MKLIQKTSCQGCVETTQHYDPVPTHKSEYHDAQQCEAGGGVRRRKTRKRRRGRRRNGRELLVPQIDEIFQLIISSRHHHHQLTSGALNSTCPDTMTRLSCPPDSRQTHPALRCLSRLSVACRSFRCGPTPSRTDHLRLSSLPMHWS